MSQEFKEKYINPYTDFGFKKRREYDDSIKAYRDINNAINTAKAEGKAEGRAEGRAEGLAEGKAKGMAEGKAKGMAEGEARARIDNARKMKADGMPYELISKYTSLSIDEIGTL